MTIENMTIKEAKQKLKEYEELKVLFNIQDSAVKNTEAHPYADLIGKAIFVRTVTFYYVARLKKVYSKELVLEHVCWIPDTGRFNDCIKSGNFDEVEPFNLKKDVLIGRGSIIDFTEWNFDLPTERK